MREPIRVLQVVPNMQQGGIENFIMNMYRSINKDNVQFDFLEHYSTDHFFDEEIRNLGGRIFRFPLMEKKTDLVSYIRYLSNLFDSHPEIRIIHGHMATTAPLYFSVAKKHGINNRIIHAHEDSYIRNLRGIVRMILIKQAWRGATYRIACSETSGRYYYGKHSFKIVRNAIDTPRFKFNLEKRDLFRKHYNIAGSAYVIGHIGRFDKQKNHQYLIKVFSEVVKQKPDAILLLVGEGQLMDAIKQEVADYNLQNHVIFTGAIRNSEDAYSAMDCFVLPSFFEGLPLTGVEAQCNGLPCIFSKAISKEICLSSNVLFLSIEDDPQVWTKALLSQSERSNSDLAVQLVHDHGYDSYENAKRLEELYLELSNCSE